MVAAQKDVPFLPQPFEPDDLTGATVHDPCLPGNSAKRIGASIELIQRPPLKRGLFTGGRFNITQ